MKLAALKPNCWAALLVLSLLFAQFVGLQHRIMHAGWQGGHAFSEQYDRTGHGSKHASHSCVALDAATLADSVSAALPVFVPPEATYALASQRIPSSWVAPAARHFPTRAPPSLG